MKKRIGIAAMVCITMLFSMASVFAEELPGEDVDNTPAEQVQQENASEENGLPGTTAEPEQTQKPAATPETQDAPKHISLILRLRRVPTWQFWEIRCGRKSPFRIMEMISTVLQDG